MENSLEQRFLNFLSQLPDSEWLDSPEIKTPINTRKADFLLNNRKLIAEIKTIKVDQRHRIDKSVDDHLNKTRGIIFGTVSSRQLFPSEEDHQTFHNKIIREITRNTEEMCRSANDQIAQTRLHFSPEASGLLIILNESIEILDPQVIAYRVCEYLNKKPRNIQYCALIFESHEIELNGVPQNQVMIIDADRSIIWRETKGYLSNLMQKWAAHNGTVYIEKAISDPSSIKYRSRLP